MIVHDGARSFCALADEWMRTRAQRKRSRNFDALLLRAYLGPAFGELAIARIGTAEVESFKADLSRLAPSSINRILTLLRAMLRHAARIGWLEEAPAVTLHRTPKRKMHFRYLKTEDEVRRFLRAAKEHRVYRQPDGFLFALYASAVWTGLRLGELCALERGALDFDRRLLTVYASHDGPTKSGEARHVPIVDALRPVLEAHLLRVPGPLVFPSLRGTRLNRNSRVFQETLRTVLRRAELEERYITFNCLRHTFASHWAMSGGDMFKLQRIMGHASIEITLSVYAHLSPHAFDADLARFNRLMPERGGELHQLSFSKEAL